MVAWDLFRKHQAGMGEGSVFALLPRSGLLELADRDRRAKDARLIRALNCEDGALK